MFLFNLCLCDLLLLTSICPGSPIECYGFAYPEFGYN